MPNDNTTNVTIRFDGLMVFMLPDMPGPCRIGLHTMTDPHTHLVHINARKNGDNTYLWDGTYTHEQIKAHTPDLWFYIEGGAPAPVSCPDSLENINFESPFYWDRRLEPIGQVLTPTLHLPCGMLSIGARRDHVAYRFRLDAAEELLAIINEHKQNPDPVKFAKDFIAWNIKTVPLPIGYLPAYLKADIKLQPGQKLWLNWGTETGPTEPPLFASPITTEMGPQVNVCFTNLPPDENKDCFVSHSTPRANREPQPSAHDRYHFLHYYHAFKEETGDAIYVVDELPNLNDAGGIELFEGPYPDPPCFGGKIRA